MNVSVVVAVVVSLLLLPAALSAGPIPLTPVTATSVECVNQPFSPLSGAFSLGKQQDNGPSMVFTVGSSPYLYAIDLWGTRQTPINLLSNRAAHMASANAQLQGAALLGNSVFLVFSRNDDLGMSGILQIDQPWSGSPVFQYHPLGSVRVYDVVTGSKALYMLIQHKTVDTETNLMRFDLAQGAIVGVRMPFSGGKLALTADERYLLAAGPTRNVTACGANQLGGGCALTFTLDPLNLGQLFSDSYFAGGCAVSALAARPGGEIYISFIGGSFCDSWRVTGTLIDNTTWSLTSETEDYDGRTTWAVPSAHSWDGFLENFGGQIGTTSSKLLFTLQTNQQVSAKAPMMVTDPSLGACLVFPAMACRGGTLPVYVFTLNQFQTPTAISAQ